jgi:hypothetical protein
MSQQLFHQASKKERELLSKLLPYLCKNKSYDYEFSPIEGYDIWDCKLFVDGKRILFEVKIRDTHYDTLFLEKIKYDDLLKYKNENKFDAVYYINYTTKGVYLARIDNLIIKHIEYIMAPVSTCDLSKGKVRKAVIGLEIGKDMKEINIKKPF